MTNQSQAPQTQSTEKTSKTDKIQKPALVVERRFLPDAPQGHMTVSHIPPNFFIVPSFVADRVGSNSCEENPELQQIIPYIVVINQDGHIFTYSRGQASGEDKLKSKLSIGLGGHIDAVAPAGMNNYQWFTQEARRELQEEVGIMSDDIDLQYVALLFDRKNSHTEDGKVYVGQVHCGLLTIVNVIKSEVTRLEQGVIENAQWMSVSDLMEPIVNDRLEDWSKAALSFVINQYKKKD